MNMVMQFVVLGNGDMDTENFFRYLGAAYPGRVGAHIGFSSELSHLIEAGCDFFLMPSLYEPCGLNQIYSLKYGTVPVVRATGGLDDTIEEWNPEKGTGTGFKFKGLRAEGLWAAIEHALAAFEDKRGWKRLMLNGMARNYEWEQQARDYAAVYDEAVSRRA